MMAVLISGRIGSAMAAEIGSMKVYQEIDALRTMNINPVHYLVLPRLVAITVALPVLVLSIAQLATVARITRTAVMEVMNEDYVRTARAMGTGEAVVLFRHALPNAALPVVTVAGLSFGRLLGGTVIVETIFALPGMGTLLINGINGRDYPVVQGVILIYASLFILINLLTDLLYTKIDPRVKL